MFNNLNHNKSLKIQPAVSEDQSDGIMYFGAMTTIALIALLGQAILQYGEVFLPTIYSSFVYLNNNLGEVCLSKGLHTFGCIIHKRNVPLLYMILFVPLVALFFYLKRASKKKIIIFNSIIIFILWIIISYEDIVNSYYFLFGK